MESTFKNNPKTLSTSESSRQASYNASDSLRLPKATLGTTQAEIVQPRPVYTFVNGVMMVMSQANSYDFK